MRAAQASWWFHRPVVYRVFDADERLIYVGASHRLSCRMAQHERASWWYPLAARVQWDFHPTKEAALAAEAVAIQEEQPAFNIRDTGRAFGDFSHVTEADLDVCLAAIRRRGFIGYIPYALRDLCIHRADAARAAA